MMDERNREGRIVSEPVTTVFNTTALGKADGPKATRRNNSSSEGIQANVLKGLLSLKTKI